MSRATQMHLTVELTDVDPFEVDVRLMDHHMWDVARAKNNWPGPGDGPMTWLGYLAFVAARRSGKIDPTTRWEDFLVQCEGVTNQDEDDDNGAADLGPTQ